MKNETTPTVEQAESKIRRTWGVFYPVNGQVGFKVIEIKDGRAMSQTYSEEVPVATFGRRCDAIRRALHESGLDCDVRGCKRCSARGETGDATITQAVARLRIVEGR